MSNQRPKDPPKPSAGDGDGGGVPVEKRPRPRASGVPKTRVTIADSARISLRGDDGVIQGKAAPQPQPPDSAADSGLGVKVHHYQAPSHVDGSRPAKRPTVSAKTRGKRGKRKGVRVAEYQAPDHIRQAAERRTLEAPVPDELIAPDASQLELIVLRHGTRFLWVLIGAAMMGGIALSTFFLAQRSSFLASLTDQRLQFWLFQIFTGLGYFAGGFLLALMSPGRTTREPVYAAVLAFIGQSLYLWSQWYLLSMPGTGLVLVLLMVAAFAWAGAWIGEKITGEL